MANKYKKTIHKPKPTANYKNWSKWSYVWAYHSAPLQQYKTAQNSSDNLPSYPPVITVQMLSTGEKGTIFSEEITSAESKYAIIIIVAWSKTVAPLYVLW